jgi:Winged helix DNA-binding domain
LSGVPPGVRSERFDGCEGRGISDRVLEGLIDAALRALDQPLTRRELAERVSRSLGVRIRAIRGGGWGSKTKVPGVSVEGLTFPAGYILHLVGARGVVCSGPSRGNEPTFVRADAWIPQWRDVSREKAEGELLRMYLQAFGPATPLDFALWTGMRLADAREIWAHQEADLARVSVDGWRAAVLRDDLLELERVELKRPPVRLLPYFDSFLLGHKERQHLVALRDKKRVYRAQGWIAPVVLVDGRAVGVWAHNREGNRLRVRVRKFTAISRRLTTGIWGEARDLGRFLGCPNVDVQIE